MGIDWDEMLSDDFVQIESGKTKTLVLKNWRPQEQFKDDKTKELRPGITFDVTEEDGKEVKNEKTWTVTAKGALKLLRPIVEKAEAEGKDSTKVEVVAVGDGKERKYSIRGVI